MAIHREVGPSWFLRDPIDADYAIVGIEHPSFPRDQRRLRSTKCMAFVAYQGKADLTDPRVVRDVVFPADAGRPPDDLGDQK